MTKQVVVSGAEQKAARYVVKRNAAKGQSTSGSVTKIANAKSSGQYRSAKSGRYITKTTSSTRTPS